LEVDDKLCFVSALLLDNLDNFLVFVFVLLLAKLSLAIKGGSAFVNFLEQILQDAYVFGQDFWLVFER